MIDSSYANKFIYGLHRGRNDGAFEEVKIIGEAYEIKGEIPDSFWRKETYSEPLMGYEVPMTKEKLLSLREEVIDLICKELEKDKALNWEKKMSPIETDNYVRLFHGLALMGVEKNDSRIPKKRENVKYNVSLAFWLEDDGSIEKWIYIRRLAWNISELTK